MLRMRKIMQCYLTGSYVCGLGFFLFGIPRSWRCLTLNIEISMDVCCDLSTITACRSQMTLVSYYEIHTFMRRHGKVIQTSWNESILKSEVKL